MGWPASLVDDAELLVSELVTNAVLHAHTGVAVSLRVGAGVLRIEVADGSLDRPRPRHPADDAVTGRGPLLVEALSTSWARERREGGKVVWFEVTRPGPSADDGVRRRRGRRRRRRRRPDGPARRRARRPTPPRARPGPQPLGLDLRWRFVPATQR